MKCPVDGSELVMTERQGVEIDYCPQCRGVWLDRGELDKVIERSAGTQYAAPAGDRRPDTQPRYRDSDYEKPRYKKRKSLLGELFDF